VDRNIQLCCVWTGVAFTVTFLVSWLVARWIPVPSPHWDAQRLAEFYDDHRASIRAGQIGALFAAGLELPFFFVIAGHILRIERGRMPILTFLYTAGAIVLNALVVICCLGWLTATFRTDIEPTTLQSWHDFCWIVFVAAFSPYVVMMGSLAVAVLTDESADPVWPRWVGYFCLWVAISSLGGAFCVFFKTGPFAYNGLIAFWLVMVLFVSWIAVMVVTMHRWTVRQPIEESSTSDQRPLVPALQG
jgi:hypothetical protein